MRKQILFLCILALAASTLTVAAVYEYQHHKDITVAAVARAQKQRDGAEQSAEGYRLSLQTSVNQVKTLSAQKFALCTQLTAAKLKNPACQ